MGIFTSYSNRDGAAVRTLAQDLDRARQAVWLDQDLRGGDAWWRAILEQIRTCDVFVLALSDNALSSKPCRAELEYARALGIPVLPVQIGPVSSLRTVSISEIQVVDYRERSASAGIALLGALNQCAAQRRALPTRCRRPRRSPTSTSSDSARRCPRPSWRRPTRSR